MTSEELATFIHLSKVKNFTLAAAQLGVVQSTVTNRISELEKEVGKRLFYRKSKGVKLTEAGEIFLRYAERILELESTSVEEMNALSRHNCRFTIGAINASYESHAKPLIEQCLKSNEMSSVKVILGRSLDLLQLLQDNALDMVFSAIPLKRLGYACDVYGEDRVVLVCKKGANEYPDGILQEEFPKLPYLMCDFMSSEVGIFIRSLFPQDNIFRLEVEEENERAVHVYEKNGFTFLPYMEMKK